MLYENINSNSTKEEVVKALEEIKEVIKTEYEEHEAYCESQGWPGNGSNYELMCEQTQKRWADELDYLYELLDQFEES